MSECPYILVLYYSVNGSVRALAREIATGIESCNIEARLRQVPPIEPRPTADDDTPECTLEELEQARAIALGSPTRFGNMAAPVKHFLDLGVKHWMNRSLAGKPACVFTSGSSLHGGQESTLLSMMIPLFHQGMILLGLEYDTHLRNTTSGGSPYGVTHWAQGDSSKLTGEEKKLCQIMGRRLARTAMQLHDHGS